MTLPRRTATACSPWGAWSARRTGELSAESAPAARPAERPNDNGQSVAASAGGAGLLLRTGGGPRRTGIQPGAARLPAAEASHKRLGREGGDRVSAGTRSRSAPDRRRAVLNLNGEPPPWADEAEQGPLFAAQGKDTEGEWTAVLGDALAEAVGEPGLGVRSVRIDWHLGASDFAAAGRERLVRLARLALGGAALSFVFDRPRRATTLAEGVQRRHPAVLLEVGLHLSRLAALVAEEVPAPQRAERLLERLKSLARLALGAAVQKRDFLRRHSRACPGLARGFLLDRARLLVAPLGLDAAVQTVLGRALCSGGEALELGGAIFAV